MEGGAAGGLGGGRREEGQGLGEPGGRMEERQHLDNRFLHTHYQTDL